MDVVMMENRERGSSDVGRTHSLTIDGVLRMGSFRKLRSFPRSGQGSIIVRILPQPQSKDSKSVYLSHDEPQR